jgi:hypothetical protein
MMATVRRMLTRHKKDGFKQLMSRKVDKKKKLKSISKEIKNHLITTEERLGCRGLLINTRFKCLDRL